MAVGSLAAIVGLGAVGGILANIALTPLTAGASLLQSYYYGSGLILGERMMYTVHWEKIKKRLDSGEEFIGVLDKIMNDDITAIANLSFKTMEQTGELYLKKGHASLSALVEELLSAVLNPIPAVDVTTEPPPPGTEEEDGLISYTIAELQQMNLAQLQSIIDNPSRYAIGVVQHAIIAKENLLVDASDEQEQKEDLDEFIADLFASETQFLQGLSNVTLATLYSSFIPQFSNQQQSLMKSILTQHAIFGVVSVRNRSSGSDANLKTFRNQLANFREQFQNNITVKYTLNELQELINAQHVLIWAWQLIYSR